MLMVFELKDVNDFLASYRDLDYGSLQLVEPVGLTHAQWYHRVLIYKTVHNYPSLIRICPDFTLVY